MTELFLRQRAYRDLRPEPVPDELIDQLIDAAIHAPSAENTQPWEFVIVTDAGIRAEIGAMTSAMWQGGGRGYAERHLDPKMLAAVDRWANGGLAVAPVHIVVCGDTTKVPEALLASSIYPAVQNLLLAAIALGLGSLLSTLPVYSGPQFRALLGLPDHLTPLALVPVGYPERPLKPGRRTPPRVHRDRWSGPSAS